MNSLLHHEELMHHDQELHHEEQIIEVTDFYWYLIGLILHGPNLQFQS